MRDWAEIPDHLIELIAEKMANFDDILIFGSVCKQWRSVAVRCKETFMKKQTQHLPWLMLPPSKGSHLRGFYNLTRRRTHQISSWECIGKKCYSSKGWLLTVGSDWGMDLLHPMTLARFKLPGIKSFGKSRHERLDNPYLEFIYRAILSVSPSLTSNFVLVVIQGCPAMPAYWRPGGKRWTLIEIETTDIGAFLDGVFYQDKCYFITSCRKIWVTDFGRSNLKTLEFITEFPEQLVEPDEDCFFEAFYLVILKESLLLVSRQASQCSHPEKKSQERLYQTIRFQVFKLDFKSLSWEKLRSLGNWSLFLGDNSSMALNALVVEGCKPNSIYFTDDDKDFYTRKGAGLDMGIFNVTYQTIEPLIEGSWRNRVSPPIFVDPTF